jgi:hypothetical protein
MREADPRYVAGHGIRPPRRGGKVRGVAREIVPGGGVELWHCDHDHAPGIRDCRKLGSLQRAEAQQCAAAWLDRQVAAGRITAMPVLTEDEDEARQAADAIVIPLPGYSQEGN